MSQYFDAIAKHGQTRHLALRIRCKAFSGYPVATQLVHVDLNGTVTVFDDVACAWTTCHVMSPRTIAKARKLAGWAQ